MVVLLLVVVVVLTDSLCLGGSFGFGSGGFALGALGGFGSSLGGGFSLKGGLTLGGDGGSLGLVGLLLGLETSLAGVAGVVLDIATLAVYLGFFGLQPLVELDIGLLLADGTLLDTDLEVTTEEDTLIAEDATDGVAGLSTILDPFDGAVEVEVDGGGVGQRIVGAKLLDKSSISRCTTIRNNDVVERLILFTMTLKSNSCWHNCLFFKCLLIIVVKLTDCKGTNIFETGKIFFFIPDKNARRRTGVAGRQEPSPIAGERKIWAWAQ